MRVLYLTPGIPADGVVGGPMGSFYNILQFSRAGHEVTALCLVPRDCPEPDERQAAGIAEVRVFRAAPSNTPAHLAANLLDPLPWPIRKYDARAYRAAVREALASGEYDLVFFNSLHSATALGTVRRHTSAPCVLFQHNVQATVMELFARVQRNPLARAYARLQWRKMLAFERRAVGWFDLVFTFSDVDARALSSLRPGTRVAALPLKLDLTRFTPDREEDEAFDLLFVAYFGWAPNEDSLRWFIDEVYPAILRRRPGTTLEVVGAGAPRWVQDLDGHRGTTTFRGRVDDVVPCLRGARVVVVPLRVGSGVRVKIVQAMAAGKAIVSTTKGCEGLETQPGRHLLVADTPEGFADAVAGLLDDPPLRLRLGRDARDLALARHDALGEDRPVVRACEELVRRARDGR
jgi:glycosyltransferase involved in cell wall biosynthesis